MAIDAAAGDITKVEKSKLKRELTLLPLFGLIYFTVVGGSFGAEPMVGWSGPGMALLLMVLTPIFFSIPNMLMVREMASMMPVEGGYYHWGKGTKDGKVKNVYLYQVADNADCMKKLGVQAVVAQTGFNAVIGMELLDNGKWKGVGVDGPEAFDPIPFMDLMEEYGFPWGKTEW